MVLESLRTIATALACFVALGSVTYGQQAEKLERPPSASTTSAPKPKDTAERRVEESRPPIFYLPDKEGNLQAVLDFPYQDFAELYRLRNELQRRDQPPAYSVDRIFAVGTAGTGAAELTVKLEVALHSAGWVRVPLRMEQGLVRGEISYKGSGRQFVQFEEGAGHVCWIRGKPDSEHELVLKLLVPLDTVGGVTRLRLSTPRATVSEMRLNVPVTRAVASVSEGASLISASDIHDGSTELALTGLDKDFQVTWRPPASGQTDASMTLEAVGTMTARFNGRSVASEARLSVRSHHLPFDRFTVRLPPETVLVNEETSGYRVTPVDIDERSEERPSVEVRLSKKTAGPVEVLLKCHRDYRGGARVNPCELAGFEVVGATRQWGTIAAIAPSEWRMAWPSNPELRQVEAADSTLNVENAVAAFEYFAVPYSLPVRFLPTTAALLIEPEYTLSVDRKRVSLDGKLKCSIGGAKISQVELELPGWEVDRVGPDQLVAADRLVIDGRKVLIPFRKPASGTVELQLQAHSKHKLGSNSCVAVLPRAFTGSMAPANVAVVPASNLELTPNAAMEGLVRQRVPRPFQGASQQPEILYYQSTGSDATFAADYHVYSQQISVDAASQVVLQRRHAKIEQKFSYSIAYEPVDRLVITVPRMLTVDNRLQIVCDGQPLKGRVLGDANGGDDLVPVALGLWLPESRMGQCELVLRYSVPVSDQIMSGQESLNVPLAMPIDGKLTTNIVTLKTERSVEVVPRQDIWAVVDPGRVAYDSRRGLRLTCPRRVHWLNVDIVGVSDAAATTIIDRAWIQTWLASSARQDRVVYQLATDRDELEISLPRNALTGQATVFVDGRGVKPRTVSQSRIVVPLSHAGEKPGHRFVVDLQYHFSSGRAPRDALEIGFPQVDGGAWCRKVYWQLVLPSREHLILAPPGLTREFAWGWAGYFWGRRPLLDQTQLEAWSGGAASATISEQTNSYLFSTFGSPTPVEIRTAEREWIVLGASGAALVFGMLLLYVKRLRHPAVLLLVGFGMLAAGLIAPEPTLLLAQAASLGLVLTLLAGFLHYGAAQRRRRFADLDEGSSVIELDVLEGSESQVFVRDLSSSKNIPASLTPSAEDL